MTRFTAIRTADGSRHYLPLEKAERFDFSIAQDTKQHAVCVWINGNATTFLDVTNVDELEEIVKGITSDSSLESLEKWAAEEDSCKCH